MATTIGTYGNASPVERGKLRSTRRSRFSFNFMTRRTRRIIRVEWVSVPLEQREDEQLAMYARLAEDRNERATFQGLLTDYSTGAWLRRSA